MTDLKKEDSEIDNNDDNNNFITIDEFDKLDIKIGKIVEAERIPKMKKILKVVVDIGEEKRELAFGGALFYQPEELINKVVIVLTNIKPRKLGDLISNGMILAADGNDDKPIILTVNGEVGKDIQLGSKIH